VLAVAGAATWGYIEVATGRPYSAAWIPYWNSAVRLGVFVLVNELTEHLRRSHARQRALAREDSLTGIANARVFEEHAHREIARSRRSGFPLTVAYLDLDGFKGVNDSFGHSEGDRLLRTIATLVAQSARATDVVARVGGDEFAVLMPDTDAEQARALLERIAGAVADGVGRRWGVGVTIGAATFREPPEDVDHAVREADALMYRGKGAGRGRIIQATWP
jgi:diguanylate cyclase (GGDEF)-like protein